eukprot:SAG11_NODE_15487_length_576_cov_1.299790_1_plen_82_part_01
MAFLFAGLGVELAIAGFGAAGALIAIVYTVARSGATARPLHLATRDLDDDLEATCGGGGVGAWGAPATALDSQWVLQPVVSS